MAGPRDIYDRIEEWISDLNNSEENFDHDPLFVWATADGLGVTIRLLDGKTFRLTVELDREPVGADQERRS